MWYLLNENQVMFFDGATRNVVSIDDVENAVYKEYLAWVAEGNEVEQWV